MGKKRWKIDNKNYKYSTVWPRPSLIIFHFALFVVLGHSFQYIQLPWSLESNFEIKNKSKKAKNDWFNTQKLQFSIQKCHGHASAHHSQKPHQQVLLRLYFNLQKTVCCLLFAETHGVALKVWEKLENDKNKSSHARNWTWASWVKARYPSH